MAIREENRVLVETRAEALALRLAETVPPDAKFTGFNGFRGVLCATRMLTSFLLTLLSWGVLHYWPDAGGAGGATDCAPTSAPRSRRRSPARSSARGGGGCVALRRRRRGAR